MPDARYKLNRIRRWGRTVGFWEALRFEALWTLRPSRVHVRLPGHRKPLAIRRATSDVAVFETVLIERELECDFLVNPRLIIDGGANVGFSTSFYAHSFPAAKVVAVEPSPGNCRALRENCGHCPNVEILEGGLWSRSCFLRIANPDDPAWSFRCEPVEANTAGAFRAYTVDEIIDRSGLERCDLLKLDIEGAEEPLFRESTEDWLPRVDAILVEIHGPECRSAVEAACPGEAFAHTPCGEKLLLRRRS